MLIGIVSDTHGNVANTRLAVRMLEALEVEAVLHCGDIGSTEIVQMLSAWPAHYVLGNCDPPSGTWQSAADAHGATFHGQFGDIALGGRRIGLLHSHDASRFRQVKQSGHYDLVCYGHTHVFEQHREGKTLVLNPGALHRAKTHTIATVDLATLQATIVPVD